MMGYFLPGDAWLIESLQNLGDWLAPVMKFFTWLGDHQAYILLIAVIYWSVDRKLGLRLALFLPFTASINSILKQAIHAPRPFWVDQGIKALKFSNGFGMPSGHAQTSTAWIYVAFLIKKKWFWVPALAVVVMIGLSRVYLGVHFPSQVLTGWMIGILVTILFIRFEPGVLRGFMRLKYRNQLGMIFLISMILLSLGIVFVILLKEWEFPAEWIRNASDDLAGQNETILSSIGLQRVAGNVGGFLGAGMGAVFLHRSGGFDIRGRWWKRVLRCLTGLAIIFLLYEAFQSIAPEDSGDLLNSLWQFSGIFSISLSVVFLIPYLLVRINLMSKANE